LPDGSCIVSVDPRFYRPAEVETLLGDASKARETLGWVPKTSFDDLVKEMATEDLKLAEQEKMTQAHSDKPTARWD
jgi:GDPmannose 4,6-dehydratase